MSQPTQVADTTTTDPRLQSLHDISQVLKHVAEANHYMLTTEVDAENHNSTSTIRHNRPNWSRTNRWTPVTQVDSTYVRTGGLSLKEVVPEENATPSLTALYSELSDLSVKVPYSKQNAPFWIIPVLRGLDGLLPQDKTLFISPDVVGGPRGCFNDWRLVVAPKRNMGVMEDASIYDDPLGVRSKEATSFYVMDASQLLIRDEVALCDSKIIQPAVSNMHHLAVKYMKPHIRGAVTDGLQYLFIKLDLNDDGTCAYSINRPSTCCHLHWRTGPFIHTSQWSIRSGFIMKIGRTLDEVNDRGVPEYHPGLLRATSTPRDVADTDTTDPRLLQTLQDISQVLKHLSKSSEAHHSTSAPQPTPFYTFATQSDPTYASTGSLTLKGAVFDDGTVASESLTSLYTQLSELWLKAPCSKKTAPFWIHPVFQRVDALLPEDKLLFVSPNEVGGPRGRFNDWKLVVAPKEHMRIFDHASIFNEPDGIESIQATNFYVMDASQSIIDDTDDKVTLSHAKIILPALRNMHHLALTCVKSHIRGVVTDGLQYVFLKLDINADGTCSRSESVPYQIQCNEEFVLDKPTVDVISSAMAHWVMNSHEPVVDGDWFTYKDWPHVRTHEASHWRSRERDMVSENLGKADKMDE
ncbi:hypothetical protein ONZ45_g10188 [Pleurotus djamor]|nr:hypothetical protein ONZ45_g10188 [Pleurotus djamor]